MIDPDLITDALLSPANDAAAALVELLEVAEAADQATSRQ